MNFLSKLIFLLKRPRVIIVGGKGSACATEAIFQVLKQYFRTEKISKDRKLTILDIFKNEVLILEVDSESVSLARFLIKKSSLPVLVVTHVGEIPFDCDFFAGEKEKTIQAYKLAKKLPAQGYLILNFDDETVREIKFESVAHSLTFGLQEGADFQVTDIKLNRGTNFKINYRGNIVPIWLEKLFGKEQIYSAQAAVCTGVIFNLNLVEISQALKSYQSLPGKMRLIKGIKRSWILDDSESATVFSMVEALEILGKIQGFKRKIAVLGDVVGVGKYTIEAHKRIGEKVAKRADFLFAFGLRSQFIAKGAQSKGMALEKISQCDTIEEGKIPFQEKIKEGDLILIDGSKEIEMGKIVNEIVFKEPGQ